MTQSKAAKTLGVTPAAVSQYLNKKRGQQEVKSKLYLEEINDAIQKISEGASQQELQAIICKCCHIITAETSGENGQPRDDAVQE